MFDYCAAVRHPSLLVVVLAATAIAGCGDDDEAGSTSDGELAGTVTVFAAASLTDAFTAIGDEFERAHPDVDVEFAFDGPSALAAQIVEGAPADVFASADAASMAKTSEEGLTTEPIIFATNELAIITAPGNPLGIAELADLTDPDLTVVICAIEVPCGSYADLLLTAADVDLAAASYEQNVRGVASKVVEGEADAGIVYVTDVIAAGDDAAMVEIPAAADLVASYPAATLAATGNPGAADAFTQFLLAPAAQSLLADHGFGPP